MCCIVERRGGKRVIYRRYVFVFNTCLIIFGTGYNCRLTLIDLDGYIFYVVTSRGKRFFYFQVMGGVKVMIMEYAKEWYLQGDERRKLILSYTKDGVGRGGLEASEAVVIRCLGGFKSRPICFGAVLW